MAIYQKPKILTLLPLSLMMMVSTTQASDALNKHLTSTNSALASTCFSQDISSNRLSNSCPVGEALWGNREPKLAAGESEFWIQCGVFSTELSADKLQRVQSKVNAPISMKVEPKRNRCLIGPYQDIATARTQLKLLQSDKLFSNSILREVEVAASSSKSVPKKEKAVQPKVVVKSEPKLKPTPKVQSKLERKSESYSVTIRKQTEIDGHQFIVPFIDNGDEGFYMEDGKPWLRASFEHSADICQKLGMNLLTKEQWLQLIDSNIMNKNKWPIQLPYWGADNQGFFKDGAVRILKNTSMLNVMCTKKV